MHEEANWEAVAAPLTRSATHDCVRGVREKAQIAPLRMGSTSAFKEVV